MSIESHYGKIVILNGVPRSGKSSIAKEIQKMSDEPWMNLGVDVFKEQITPEKFGPGIGMRPGANRAELETYVPRFFSAMFDSIAAHSRQGLNVVSDVGIHENYSQNLSILQDCIKRLEGLPVLFVGVRCPIREIMIRRNKGQEGREGVYAQGNIDGPYPESVEVWQESVHSPGIYDLEVDTSVLASLECAQKIRDSLISGNLNTAFDKLSRQHS